MLLLALDPFDKIIHQDVHLNLTLGLSPLLEVIIVSQERTSACVEKCEEDSQSQQTDSLHSNYLKYHFSLSSEAHNHINSPN